MHMRDDVIGFSSLLSHVGTGRTSSGFTDTDARHWGQVVNGAVLSTSGASAKVCLNGLPGTMTITLAWADYPGSQTAAKALVNDLDLTVNVNGMPGASHKGNGVTDRINNVERVRRPPPWMLVRVPLFGVKIWI
jgi:hypothetical protein